MRWTKIAMGLTIAVMLQAGSSQPAGAQSPKKGDDNRPTQRPVREEHDILTGAVFSAAPDGQGNVRFLVSVDDFTLEKILAPSGDATIRLTQGKDIVTFVLNHSGYVVQRGKRTAAFNPQSGQTDDFDSIRSVLLGSKAVRTFRLLSASLEDRDDDRDLEPLMIGTLIDSAIVQLLDGDTGAPGRIGKRIVRKQRAAMRPAKLRPAGLMFEDCVLKYEMSLVDAWDLYQTCRATAFTVRWYYWYLADTFCELEWLLRSQQYIYQFAACFAYPF